MQANNTAVDQNSSGQLSTESQRYAPKWQKKKHGYIINRMYGEFQQLPNYARHSYLDTDLNLVLKMQRHHR